MDIAFNMLARAIRVRPMMRGIASSSVWNRNRPVQSSLMQYCRDRSLRLQRLHGANLMVQRFYSRKRDDSNGDIIMGPDLMSDQDTHLPATVAVPDVWPHVPLLAMRKNPLFPRFMKIVEVRFHLTG